MSGIVKILMERDGMTEEEAMDLLQEARQEVENEADPEEILNIYFGLEPDYIFELL